MDCQLTPNPPFVHQILLFLNHSRLFLLKCFSPLFYIINFSFSIGLFFFLTNLETCCKISQPKKQTICPLIIYCPSTSDFFFSAPLYRKTLKSTVCLCFVPSHFILNQLQLGSVPLFPLKLFLSHLHFASSLGLIWSALSEAFNTGPFPPVETLHLVFRTQSFCVFLFTSLAASNQSCLMNLRYVPKCPKTHLLVFSVYTHFLVISSVSWI